LKPKHSGFFSSTLETLLRYLRVRRLIILAIVGFIFRNDPARAWRKMTEQMSYDRAHDRRPEGSATLRRNGHQYSYEKAASDFLDKSALDVVANIAQTAAHPNKGMPATIIGIF